MPIGIGIGIGTRFGPYLTGGGSITITAPVLAQNPVVTNDATPDFDVSLTSPIVGDTITLQWSLVSDFSVITGTSTNTVDAGEAAALLVTFTTGSLSDYATWYFRAKHTGPGRSSPWSNTVTVVVETAAPTLTSPTDVETSSTTGTGTVSTNEGQGTLYWVLSSASNTPTAAQVRAGQDHTGGAALKSGSQAVTVTGVQTVLFTGLTAETLYYANYEHSDPTPNHSTVSHADGFTTPAGVDITAPTITSATTANNVENVALSHSLTANESVTWSIVGGADQARFELSGSTLRWASNGTKDYEAPNDADTNNTYVVTVRATDLALNTADQTVTITVTDADEVAPTITSATTANNAENTQLAHALTANESVTWSIVGGADQARFEISGSTLRWASNGTKDYEIPNDADTNNTYVVTVRATDTSSNTSDQTITVTVTDVAIEGTFTALKTMGDFNRFGNVDAWGLTDASMITALALTSETRGRVLTRNSFLN